MKPGKENRKCFGFLLNKWNFQTFDNGPVFKKEKQYRRESRRDNSAVGIQKGICKIYGF